MESCMRNQAITSSHVHVFELEGGNVIHTADNKTLWTAFTLTSSTIGMGLSAVALLLLILTALLFREWRKSYKNQLLIQFMLSRFFYTLIRYMNDIQTTFDVESAINNVVTLDVLLLIYTEMALVTWMFVFSRQMYLSLVKVFDPESVSIWKVSMCAWFIPAVVSFLLYLVYYVRNTEPIYFMVCLIFVKWPVLITNAVLLSLALKSVLTNSMNVRSNAKIIVVMTIMIFVFCFQQMFIDVYKVIVILIEDFNIISTTLISSNILTIYQCAFSIFFWLFGNANTRKLWTFKKNTAKDKLTVRFSS